MPHGAINTSSIILLPPFIKGDKRGILFLYFHSPILSKLPPFVKLVTHLLSFSAFVIISSPLVGEDQGEGVRGIGHTILLFLFIKQEREAFQAPLFIKTPEKRATIPSPSNPG
jgi:hypothetical protein